MENTNNKGAVRYREASKEDTYSINTLFQEHISENYEYISHGEMQMGVALNPDLLSREASLKWRAYLTGLLDRRNCTVILAERRQQVIGFVIVRVTSDGDAPYGILNDILVHELDRGEGIGKSMLDRPIGWLRSKGIRNCYLESGRHNHFAHDFFARHGFRHISNTFHKSINDNSEFDFSDKTEE